MVQLLKVLLAGIALSFSFEPFGWSVLSWLALYVLFDVVNKLNTKQGLKAGWWFGLGYFGFGVHWIYNSVSLFGGAVLPLAVAVTLLFVLVMTIFPALTVWLYLTLRGNYRGVFNAILFASIWLVSELLRGKIMGGFPWLLVGYSQTSTLMGSLAPLIGAYGIGFVWIWFACAFVPSGFAHHSTDAPQSIGALFKQSYLRLIGMLACVGILAVALVAASRVDFTAPKDTQLAIRMVQANIPQELKFSKERLRSSLEQYTRLSLENLDPSTQLIVWPETAIPTYYSSVEKTIAPFVEQLRTQQVDLITGVFTEENGKFYNSVKQLGSQSAVYKKRHLVPFGEFMPFRFLLEPIKHFIAIPMSDLSAGDGPHKPLSIAGEQVGISICYEDVFGEEMRAVLPDATVLINVSNDAWFGTRIAPHQHEQIAQMRARELGRPLVRVTNTGVSSVIDHNGIVGGRIAQNRQGVLDVVVKPRTGITPYARTGNYPIAVLALLIVAMFWAQTRRKAV
ncbi:MAG: apolipoprotein N-acyltransferase [Granulosicoccaceae bacterium]